MIYDQTGPAGDDAINLMVRKPIGVVAAILPWNFPLLMMAWKIGPALAAGCSVIVKPAAQTSMSAPRLAELVAATGRRFLQYSADSTLKKADLECCGKNSAAVLEDAENLDHVPKASACLTKGALAGGTADAAFVEPTLHGVKKNDKVARDEIFGPILSVVVVASSDEADAAANDTENGRTASVFSASARIAVCAGTVTVNRYDEGDASKPFGGYRQSGFMGRDNGIHAHDQYTEIKTTWIGLGDPADSEAVG